mmetsp:Transcript_44631/g.111126  ORF Transcript_44631/g.111126 Transcript_44631/m.111126 type:complete len:244 (+) Transcript_44631:305-1036(+)
MDATSCVGGRRRATGSEGEDIGEPAASAVSLSASSEGASSSVGGVVVPHAACCCLNASMSVTSSTDSIRFRSSGMLTGSSEETEVALRMSARLLMHAPSSRPSHVELRLCEGAASERCAPLSSSSSCELCSPASGGEGASSESVGSEFARSICGRLACMRPSTSFSALAFGFDLLASSEASSSSMLMARCGEYGELGSWVASPGSLCSASVMTTARSAEGSAGRGRGVKASGRSRRGMDKGRR